MTNSATSPSRVPFVAELAVAAAGGIAVLAAPRLVLLVRASPRRVRAAASRR